MGESLLSRVSRSSLLDTALMNPAPTPLQAQVDTMVGSTENQLASLNFVVSSFAGAATYGLIRFGFIRQGLSVLKEASLMKGAAGSAISYAVAMMGGSAAYEFMGRSLLDLEGKKSENPNLWGWGGKGGIGDGWKGSALSFGSSLIAGETAGRLGLLFSKGSPRLVAYAGAGLMGLLGFLIANKKFTDIEVNRGTAPEPSH